MKIKQQKREDAIKRNELWNKLTPQQKIQQLDQKFGIGIGAKKQRTKLQKQIEEQKEEKKQTKK